MNPVFYIKCLLLYMKRILKKPVYLILLLLFPALAVFFSYTDSQENRLNIALYTQADSGFTYDLVQNILSRKSVCHFYLSPSEERLYQDVLTGHAECGYLFPDDLSDRLDQGKKTNLVDLVISSSTTMSKITNEIVYSELFELYSLHILESYLLNDSLLSEYESPDPSEMEALYRKYLTNDSTFAFDIENSYDDYSSVKKGLTVHIFVGMTGILILLGGISGLLQYTEDEEKKRHDHVPFSFRKYLACIEIFSPLLLFIVTGALCLLITGYFSQPSHLVNYLLYAVLSFLLCLFFYPLRRKRTIFLTVLPLYLLGCLVLTPIFMDVTTYLPDLSWISRFFITDYLFLY